MFALLSFASNSNCIATAIAISTASVDAVVKSVFHILLCDFKCIMALSVKVPIQKIRSKCEGAGEREGLKVGVERETKNKRREKSRLKTRYKRMETSEQVNGRRREKMGEKRNV